MHQYRQIIFRLRQGESQRSIERAGLAGRRKIAAIALTAKDKGWLDPNNELPTDEILNQFFNFSPSSVTKASVLNYQKQIDQWYQQGIQASTIHATLQRLYGFIGAYDCVQRYVKKLKLQSIAVTTILDFKPGECAQVDFGSGPKLIHPMTGEMTSTWIFVMVLAFSRHLYAEIVLKQDVETWLGCHRRAFEWFGGVVHKVTIDNAKCAITKACYYDPVVQRAYGEFAEGYGFIVDPCPPRDPAKKGRVESGVKYVKNNFVPLREFRSTVDANPQLKAWTLETAGNRIHGSTRQKPLVLFEETEKHLLKALPVNPPECASWHKVILHSDCHVQFLKCRYSAPYKLAKKTLWLRANETTIRLFHEHQLVAVHPRLMKPGDRHTLNEHLPPNAVAYAMQDPQWCLKQAKTIGPFCEAAVKHLLSSSVVNYLRAVQGIVGMQKKYGAARLEAACKRAVAFQSIQYRTIANILKKGLEYEQLPQQEAFDALAEVYTGGGRFSRDPSTLLQ